MQKTRKFSNLVLKGTAYGILGTFIVSVAFELQDYLTNPNISGLAVDYIREGIGALWIFLGLSISAIFGNLIFGKTIKSFLLKWFFILITSSIMTIFMQMAFLIYHSDMTTGQIISAYLPENIWRLLGLDLLIKLFIILTPFTFLFATLELIIEEVQNRNSLN